MQQGSAGYVNDIDPASNRLQRAAGLGGMRNFTYDAEGNIKTDGTLNFEFALHGRMRSVSGSAGKTTYWYNALGQRVRKTGQDTTYYFYDGEGRVLGEYDRNGNAIQETVYLNDMPVVVLKPEQGGTVPYYIYADHINTPRVIARASDNAMMWRWDSADPFGVAAPDEGLAGTGAFSYNPRFPGQLFDAESGLHQNYFRDYDPRAGRYLQSDPIGLNGGINTYAYVRGNPLSYIDPFGLQTWPGDAGPSTPRPTMPGPFDILQPGTQANNDFVRSVNRLIKSVKDACEGEKNCPACNPPAGEQFNKVTHYVSHSPPVSDYLSRHLFLVQTNRGRINEQR